MCGRVRVRNQAKTAHLARFFIRTLDLNWSYEDNKSISVRFATEWWFCGKFNNIIKDCSYNGNPVSPWFYCDVNKKQQRNVGWSYQCWLKITNVKVVIMGEWLNKCLLSQSSWHTGDNTFFQDIRRWNRTQESGIITFTSTIKFSKHNPILDSNSFRRFHILSR